jgi:hypothetical protein
VAPPLAPVTVGIEVARARLDVAVRPSGDQWQAPDNEASVAASVRMRAHPARAPVRALWGVGRADPSSHPASVGPEEHRPGAPR